MGLKENTLSLLYALDDGAPHTQKQICEEWLIPKTTINTVVKECVANGYVTLAPGEHSHEKLICLTERGKGYAQADSHPGVFRGAAGHVKYGGTPLPRFCRCDRTILFSA